MTYLGPETVVSFVGMNNLLAYIGGGVIVAVMFLAVFVGGATLVMLPQVQLMHQLQGGTTELGLAGGQAPTACNCATGLSYERYKSSIIRGIALSDAPQTPSDCWLLL